MEPEPTDQGAVIPGQGRVCDSLQRIIPDGVMNWMTAARFICEDQIAQPDVNPIGRDYVCIGFPNSKNRTLPRSLSTPTPTMLAHTGIARNHGVLPHVADVDDHILIDHDSRYSRDNDGKRVSSIGFRGCSGGLVIDLGPLWTQSNASADYDPVPAAMIIEMHKSEKVVVATRLSSILSTMSSAGPR